MDFRSAHLKRPPVLAAVVLVGCFSPKCNTRRSRRDNPFGFLHPRNDTVSSNVPTLSPKSLESLDFGNSAHIPLPFDLDGPPVDTPPPPVALTISPAEQAQLQDLSDRRKNWILLTPAEILGTTTPEKILGIQEHDAAGQPKNLTAVERYTERQNQMLSANTNAFQNGIRLRPGIFPGTAAINPTDSTPSMVDWKTRRSWRTPALNSRPDNRTLAGPNQNGDRSKLFDSPTPLPAPNPAQQLNLERFRQLLGSSPSPAPAATPSSNDKLFSLPEMSPDVKLDQPSLNPIGASFTPLNSGVGKPASLPTLPTCRVGTKLHIVSTGCRLGAAAAAVDVGGPAALRCSATEILTPTPGRGSVRRGNQEHLLQRRNAVA
jgi:hypothetical protein